MFTPLNKFERLAANVGLPLQTAISNADAYHQQRTDAIEKYKLRMAVLRAMPTREVMSKIREVLYKCLQKN